MRTIRMLSIRIVLLLLCVYPFISPPSIHASSGLNGSFIYTEYLTIPEINPLIQEFVDMKMDTIVIARARVKTGGCDSNTYRWDSPDMINKIHAILTKADAHNLHVYIGLTQPSDVCNEWRGNTNRIQDAADTKVAINAILALGSHPSLNGWYIPPEPSIILDWPAEVIQGWHAYFKAIVDAIHGLSQLPIVMSPMLCGADNKNPQDIADRALALKNATGVDIQAWQDGGNCTALNWQRPGKNPTYQLSDYFQALSTKLGKDNFWANNELFGFSTPNKNIWDIVTGVDWDLYKPASFTRIKNQIAQSSSASKKISWLQSTMLTKSAYARYKESDRLFDAYQAYYNNKNEYIIPQSITWNTPPKSPYLDQNNNKLSDGQTGDNTNYANPNWVGVLDTAKFTITLTEPTHVFWVGIHVLNSSAQSIYFPNSMTVECSQDNSTYSSLGSWNLPVHKANADYLFANPTVLDATCTYLRVTLPNTGWTFLSEVEIVGNTPTKPKSGDVTGEGTVDISDYNSIVSHFGNPYTIFDYNALVRNYNKKPTATTAVTHAVTSTGTPTQTPTQTPTHTPTNTPTNTPIPVFADELFVYGNVGDIPIVGNWFGGKTDVPAVIRGKDWLQKKSFSGRFADATVTVQYDPPAKAYYLACDWIGSGIKTPTVISNGIWNIRMANTSGAPDSTFGFGLPTDIPVCGDWDGDGAQSPGIFRGGQWFLSNRKTNPNADIVFSFGLPTDIPITGHWTGTKQDFAGIFRSGIFYLKYANTDGNADAVITFGNPGDTPIAGDWTGSGKSQIGVVRNTTWYFKK